MMVPDNNQIKIITALGKSSGMFATFRTLSKIRYGFGLLVGYYNIEFYGLKLWEMSMGESAERDITVSRLSNYANADLIGILFLYPIIDHDVHALRFNQPAFLHVL